VFCRVGLSLRGNGTESTYTPFSLPIPNVLCQTFSMNKLTATTCLTIKRVIRMLKKLICVGFLFALVGCKAEIVETKVKTSDLKKSISGKIVSVPFSAVLSVMGDDANVRAQVKVMRGSLRTMSI